MRLSAIKKLLPTLENVVFQIENGDFIPEHFHVTEVGTVIRHFIDCGGTIRHENTANFQLWSADDYAHRLKPEKLLHIIRLSEEKLGMVDAEIEVEYQSHTIGKYGLEYNGSHFVLTATQTACLAADACGVKAKLPLASLNKHSEPHCQPESGCCQS